MHSMGIEYIKFELQKKFIHSKVEENPKFLIKSFAR